MSVDRSRPPTDWPGLETAGLTLLTDGIFYGWLEHETNPFFWHWCPTYAGLPEKKKVSGGWVGAGTSAHTLVSREPLHLEPSLLWQCCGTHGFVRGGEWIPA
ncbi:hypothetical protein AQJ30_27630 [Streptomyces longwoodensis]|uniref:Uncharacterized protein n=1 Tax=Streptomyces longwoodensis TaxID=68231 RepID=A0A124HQB5_9ACTN|nr:hypothetical protein [Streptomyces longwoodensis]KUN34842.1 hypothetical protein AQJ30_27630 [Streptomyces longwoodensis]